MNSFKKDAQKWAATMLARQACRTDDVENFEKALERGADLREAADGVTLWSWAVACGAGKCFSKMLPSLDLLSGPHAEQAEELAAMAGKPAAPGGAMGMFMPSAASVGAAELGKLAGQEIARQRGRRQSIEAVAIGAGLSEGPKVGGARRAAL